MIQYIPGSYIPVAYPEPNTASEETAKTGFGSFVSSLLDSTPTMDHFAICLDQNRPVWICNLVANPIRVTGWELPGWRQMHWQLNSFRSLSPIDWFYVHNHLLEGGRLLQVSLKSEILKYPHKRHFLFRDELKATDDVIAWFRMIADQHVAEAIQHAQNRDLNQIQMAPHRHGGGIYQTEFSALGYSIAVDNVGFFLWAIENGGKIDAECSEFRQSCLHLAAFSRSTGFLRPCLARTTSLDIVDSVGISPLCIAIRGGNLTNARLLLSGGADASFGGTDSEYGEEHYPVLHSYTFPMFELLRQHGADFNRVDHRGDTPLHLNAKQANRDVFIGLVDAGLDPDRPNHEGRTPYDVLRDDCEEAVFNGIFVACRKSM